MDKPASITSGIAGELVTRRRDLPHWEMGGATYFLTFRLHGPPGHISALTSEERALVKKAIVSLHGRMWHVHILVVMLDHLHILATPLMSSDGKWYSLATILQRVKGGTAYCIDTLRYRTGSLWQRESYDRIVRHRQEFDEKAAYILNNLVRAGITEDGWEYDGLWCDTDAGAAG